MGESTGKSRLPSPVPASVIIVVFLLFLFFCYSSSSSSSSLLSIHVTSAAGERLIPDLWLFRFLLNSGLSAAVFLEKKRIRNIFSARVRRPRGRLLFFGAVSHLSFDLLSFLCFKREKSWNQLFFVNLRLSF